ncbi:MAG: FecR domain-containing protein, partial [Planctomycetes bacterium]|nr:FecR domain-containing protein [Planctomycetota bacterium]
MNCSQAQNHFSAYIEGFLGPVNEEALEAHLNECPECSQRVDELRRTIELLHDAYAGLAVDSREVAPRVAGRAAENARRPKMARRPGIAGLWKVAAALIIAAGAVSIFLMSKTGPTPPTVREPQAPGVAEAPERAIERTGIAHVEVRRGAVGLRPALGARWSLAREDTYIEPNDFIRVGDDALSCTRVSVADGVKISMNTSSTVQFVAKNHVQVFAGDAHFSVPTGTPFTVDTPLGAISVKGTTFDVSVQPGQASVAVWQGVVEVAAHDKQVEVSAGDMCVVTAKEITAAAAPAGTPWLAKLDDLPADETLGRLVATIDGKEVPLSVKSHRVTVTIRDQIAYTLIDEEFQNHTGSRLEGTFYYPLPADASISRFAMYIGDTLMEGEVVERMRAREVYESIVRRRRDPALLEWMGGNQFKARVFPIEPHSTKRVFIGYTQVLPRVDNVVSYTYPLKSEKLTKNPLSSLHVEVDAYSTPAIAAFDSLTHNCRIEADDHHGRATFSAADYIPTRDFVVSYTVTGEDAELYTVPHWRDDERGYFLAFISPRVAPQAIESGAEQQAANVLLMLDTSASMAGDNFATAKRIASTYLNFLGDEDRFNILLYDVEPRLVFPEFVDNLAEFRKLAAEKIAEVDPFGAGDLAKAIPAAADALREAQKERAARAK